MSECLGFNLLCIFSAVFLKTCEKICSFLVRLLDVSIVLAGHALVYSQLGVAVTLS